MFRNVGLSLGTLALLITTAPVSLRAADDGSDMVGTYRGTSSAGGYTETWQIKMDKGNLAVVGTFRKGTVVIGAFQGKNVKYADGKMTFQQVYIKKPDPSWSDGTEITATLSDDKLEFTWANGGQTGSNSLERLATADQLAGTWEGTSSAGGFKEVWKIKVQKNAISVSGSFLKDDKEVGSFQGTGAKFAKGALTFTQKYQQKPDTTWTDGNHVTAKLNGDKLSVTWKNGKETGESELMRAKP